MASDPAPDDPGSDDPPESPGPVRIVANGLAHPMEALSLPVAAATVPADSVDPMFAPPAEAPDHDVPPSFS